MATPMVRKQLYLEPDQERRLKALAATHGRTEAQIMRDALNRFPDPASSEVARLIAAGLVEPETDDDLLSDAEFAALEDEFAAWLDERAEPLDLAEAVLADRADR